MSNEAFAASAEMARQQAFVEANRSTVCVRCKTKGVLNKRGHCFACNELRLASMKLDPVKEEEARRQADTIYSLLTGFPQVSGADLDHCNSAMSGRASLVASMKNLGALENFIAQNPANSEAAWHNYLQIYERCWRIARDVKFHEAAVKANFPNLVLAPLLMPKEIQRQAEREWMEV